jgi:hypothetical protein
MEKNTIEKTFEIDQQILRSKQKYNDVMNYKSNLNIEGTEVESLIVLRVIW